MTQPVPPPVQPPRGRLEHSDSFILEWTRLAGSGLVGGRPADGEAALCLTASDVKDAVGGFGLQMRTCESSLRPWGTRAINRTDPALRRRQLWQLDVSGRLMNKDRGLCIRRMRCGRGFMYDVGDCEGIGYIASFEARRPMFRDMSKLRLLGTPEAAVYESRCITCGPYLLNEKCLYRGKMDPSGGQGSQCGGSWQGRPGWTKMPATYVGDAAVEGREPYAASLDSIGDRLPGAEEMKDMAGLGPAAFEGVCGSHVTDGPTMDSIFVLHRQPLEAQAAAGQPASALPPLPRPQMRPALAPVPLR